MKKEIIISLAGLAFFSVENLQAQVPANSDYKKGTQTRFSRDILSDAFDLPNFVNCYLSKAGIREMVGRGRYHALVDAGKCESGASGASSDGQATVPVYEASMVESYIENNSLKAKLWLNFVDQGTPYRTFVAASIDESDVNKPPYGKWRIDYCDSASQAGCTYSGFAQVDGAQVTVLEKNISGTFSRKGTAFIAGANNANGYGKIETIESSNRTLATFRSGQNSYRALINQDGSAPQDVCYSPNINHPGTRFAMWDTNLYNSTSGQKIDVFGGFRVKREESSDYEGYASFWGLHWWNNADINNSQVSRVIGEKGPNGENQQTLYDFYEVPGSLRKYTATEKTLNQISGIEFNAYVSSVSLPNLPNAPITLVLKWNSQSSKIIVTGYRNSANQYSPLNLELATGEFVSAFSTPYLSGWVNGTNTNYSIQLANSQWVLNNNNNTYSVVYSPIDLADIRVKERKNQVIKPNAIQSLSLYCAGECHGHPAGNPETIGQAKNRVYFWDSSTGNLRVNDINGIVPPTPDQYLSTGKLLSSANGMAELACNSSDTADSDRICHWNDSPNLTEWYQWESGPNTWNKQQYLKVAGTNNFVNFEPPMQLTYLVPDLPANGAYAGKQAFIQYPGAGQLWIPGKCVNRINLSDADCNSETGWVNEFIIPTTEEPAGRVTVEGGGNTYLVKWFDMGVYFAPFVSGSAEELACKSELSDFSQANAMVLPVESEFLDPSSPSSPNYIGPWVSISGSPAVIDGVLQ